LSSDPRLLGKLFIPFAALQNCQFLSILEAPTPDINIDLLLAALISLLMPDALPQSRPRAIAARGKTIDPIPQNLEVRCPMLNMTTADPEFSFTCDCLDFTQCCFRWVRERLTQHGDGICARIGVEKFRTLADSLGVFERR
jgi:hypothetical protein